MTEYSHSDHHSVHIHLHCGFLTQSRIPRCDEWRRTDGSFNYAYFWAWFCCVGVLDLDRKAGKLVDRALFPDGLRVREHRGLAPPPTQTVEKLTT